MILRGKGDRRLITQGRHISKSAPAYIIIKTMSFRLMENILAVGKQCFETNVW